MVSMRRFALRAAAEGSLFAQVPRKAVLDSAQLGCAVTLFVLPFVFAFPPAPAWNLWVAGYAMLTFSAAALVAEADWEPRANLTLGLWLSSAPWILDFSHETAATLVHLVGGGLVSLLSAFELLTSEQSPPRRFGPAAARRAELIATIRAIAPAAPRKITAPALQARRRFSTKRLYLSARSPQGGCGRTRVARAQRLGACRARAVSFETPRRSLQNRGVARIEPLTARS